MRFDVNELTLGSALELARENSSSFVTFDPSYSSKIEIAQLFDVLYLPSLLLHGQSLQTIKGRVVPIEANFYWYVVDFIKQKFATDRNVMYDSEFETDEFLEDVCILGNIFSRNFTHWHEELMKVLIIERSGIACRYALSGLPDFATELLMFLGINRNRILEIDRPCVFRSALFTTPINYSNVADFPEIFFALRDAINQIDVSPEPSFSRRLWLHRGEQTRLGRSLVNTDEVFRCLERYSLQIVDIGALPLRTQISVAQNVDVMCGLHGSHFVHSQLMKERSKIIECFSPLYLNPTYTDIYRILRHRYFQISSTNTPVFPYSHGTDVEVDCAQLELALQEACEF